MKTRIITALLMTPLLVFVYFGGWPLLIISGIFSLVALKEFFDGFKNIGVHPPYILGVISTLCLYAIIIYGEFVPSKSAPEVYTHLLCMWVSGTMVAALIYDLFQKGGFRGDGIMMFVGCMYIVFFISHITIISRISEYKDLVWLVFIIALGSDIFAYFIGCAFGKHKLCPEISPKKTIEGSIGGVIGSTILCIIFALVFDKSLIHHCIRMGIIGSLFSQAGDLIASMFKRKMGIKDYGNLFPGHGGLLDRFDSVLFTAPFVYYYILVVMRPELKYVFTVV